MLELKKEIKIYEVDNERYFIGDSIFDKKGNEYPFDFYIYFDGELIEIDSKVYFNNIKISFSEITFWENEDVSVLINFSNELANKIKNLLIDNVEILNEESIYIQNEDEIVELVADFLKRRIKWLKIQEQYGI